MRSEKPDRWGAYAQEEMVADAMAVVERFVNPPSAEGLQASRPNSIVFVAHSFGTFLALRCVRLPHPACGR